MENLSKHQSFQIPNVAPEGGLEAGMSSINQSKLQRAPPAFHSQTTLINQHAYEDSPPYSILSDAGGSGSILI